MVRLRTLRRRLLRAGGFLGHGEVLERSASASWMRSVGGVLRLPSELECL